MADQVDAGQVGTGVYAVDGARRFGGRLVRWPLEAAKKSSNSLVAFWRHGECNAVIDYNDFTQRSIDIMATLTIRDLDETLKRSLRVRAASRNRSMEEEARQILRAALQESPLPATDLAARIRARFAGLGDVELPIAEREPVRPPPSFGEEPRPARRTAAKRSSRGARRS